MWGAFNISDRQKYIISLFVVVALFAIVNYFHITRRVTCDDCYFPYGLPFPFFREGGYEGGRGFVWIGAVLDALVVLALGVGLGSMWQRHRRKLRD